MSYRPRELVVRAHEAAALLLAALDRNEMVGRFLNVRRGVPASGARRSAGNYREQLETIRREAVLAMALRIEKALPTRMKVNVTMRGMSRPKKQKKGKKGSKPKQRKRPSLELAIPLLDMFREEFFVALGRALDWDDDEANEFWRDLEILREPEQRRTASARRNAHDQRVGLRTLRDRVGLLLDPSLMEQSRRAAAKFEAELNTAADQVLRKVFARRREN